MALANALNFYTYSELATYSYTAINGTIYFNVIVTVESDRSVISGKETVNIATVKFKATSNIDKWECRATLDGASHGVGMGLLINSGNAIAANTEIQFTIPHSALTLGDGIYRISIYVQKDNIWYGG